MCDDVGPRTRLGRPPTIAPTPDLAAVLNIVVDAVTVQDGNGRLVYANTVAARLLGFDTPDELLGTDLAGFGTRYTIYDEQGAPFPWDRLPGRLVLDGQDAQEALLRYREEATGAEWWAVVHAAPLTAADGSRLAVNVVRDVTDRINAERALREREARLRAVLAAQPDLMFVQAPDGTFVDFHANVEDRLFVPPPAFLGKKAADVLPPDVAAAVAPALEHTAKTGELTTVDYSLPISGEERHYEARLVRLDEDRVLSIVRDRTDRVRAEAELEERRRFEDRIAAASPAILYVFDVVLGRTVFVNQAVSQLLGYDSEAIFEIADPRFSELLHPEDQARWPEMAAEIAAAADGEIVEQTYRLRHASGEWRWVTSRATVMTRTPDGDPHLVAAAALDISAQRAAEDALRESEARYRAVVDLQTELVSRYLPDTTLTFVNDTYCRFFDRTREELIGTPFLRWLPPSERPGMLRIIESILATSAPVTYEHAVEMPDGSIRHLQWVDRAVRDADGQVVELQGVGRDVTAQRAAEDALRESEARYRAVVDSQTELVTRYLPDTTLTFVNDAYCRYFEQGREDLFGQPFIQWLPPAASAYMLDIMESIMSGSGPLTSEHDVVKPDGSIGRMQWVDHAIRNASGAVVELQGVGRDITELRRVEAALRESEARYRTWSTARPTLSAATCRTRR